MGKLARLLQRLNELRAARTTQATPEAATRTSRTVLLYNPPEKPPRPFEADYPHGTAPRDDTLSATSGGQILRRDMDGRPLTASTVIGRTLVDGRDQPLPPGEIDALAERLIGSRPETVPGRLLHGDSGRIVRRISPDTGEPTYAIQINSALAPELQQRAAAHEIGHFLDDTAGPIDTTGLSRELADVYNTLNTGRERATRRMGPQHVGYSAEEVPRELMAEAIRAYLTDPNYLKTVAPKTAAAIRAAVNPHPRLRDTIQFNALPPVAVGISALAPSSQEQASNRLVQLFDRQPASSRATGLAEPVENPQLHAIADAIDTYRREHPLLEHLMPVSMEGTANLLRTIGRPRPVVNRLLEVANIVL